jgi:Kelch motif/Galactose oxidase, central domain
MIIKAPGWHKRHTASRIFARVLAAAVATVLPLAMAGGPAAAAVHAVAVHALLGNTAPGPAGRVWTSWADDPATGQVVLFGGDQAYRTSGPDNVLGSTWTWNGSAWTKQQPAAAPSPRTGAAMVYDAATGQLLLFGGSSHPFSGGGYLGDTWTWDGTTWTELHPATSPPARHNADMIYDAASSEVILFGGYDGHYLSDTWAWDGTTWTQLHPAASPPPRDTHSLVYDPATQTAILFGGFNGEGLSDTWSWDGTTWTQLSPATSPGMTSTAWQAAYDDASQQLVLYGGDANTHFSNETWAWTGSTWTQLQPAANAGRRAYGSLTYDPALQRLVMFGGSNRARDLTSLWEWNGTTWQRA